MGRSGPEGKPFKIPKQLIGEAYKQVKANKGAAGVDGQSIEDFEADLRNNLYKIWNRMSSGSYFPPPVRAAAASPRSPHAPRLPRSPARPAAGPGKRSPLAHAGCHLPSLMNP